MTKVIKREFEILEDLKVKYVSLLCDTSLDVFNNEFNQLSEIDDDLFIYEVEVANILCDSIKDDDSEQRVSHEADDDMGYDPSDVASDDEVELTDKEFSNNDDEVAFKMIKYSFGQDEEYVAIKEDEYDDLARTNDDACRAYQEIFRMIDEGWMDFVKEISTNIGGEFTNLEILKCWSLETSRR
ncbi:hypothetical protein Tco_1221682, partial [Tanacetum coccineum]